MTCSKCSSPMVIKRGRRGEFLACSAYPECRNAMPFERAADGKIIPKPKPEIQLPESVAQFIAAAKCDKCSKPMVLKQSFGRFFLACSGYPKCKSSGKFPPEIAEALKAVTPKREPKAAPVLTEHKCDKCGSPMAIVSSGRGLATFACSGGCDSYESIEIEDLTQPESEVDRGGNYHRDGFKNNRHFRR